ncbi:MAG: M42 family peptidase, partial [Anaerolineae bacterium]|nr:M42 family peptidase [Anaerolineae bacterium]
MTMQYLQALSEAVGISGQEDAVRKIILDAIRGHVDAIRIDALGSVLAVKRGTNGDNLPRVMLAAHMDEVGFMVTGFDSNGLIRFTPIGGVDERILPALRVKIGTDGVNGVIIWTPIHKNRDQKIVKQGSLRIDIGATNKDGA